jgi:hypothetical protein
LCSRSSKLFYFTLAAWMVTMRHLGKDRFCNATATLKVMSTAHRYATTFAYVYLLPVEADPRSIRAGKRRHTDSRVTSDNHSIQSQHSNL